MAGPKLDLDLLDEEPELRFQIETLIGEGSFGEVHKVKSRLQLAIIKVI